MSGRQAPMYTTTSSIPDHAPMLAYCQVGSMMSRFSMMEMSRAMAARQPLYSYVSVLAIRGNEVAVKYSQRPDAEQTHDRYLSPCLHLESPDLDGRKNNHSHILNNAH